jgi:8-oxo-dGTP pyrophosphatase MutT (NUDIX family)
VTDGAEPAVTESAVTDGAEPAVTDGAEPAVTDGAESAMTESAVTESVFGEDWIRGPDGMLHRNGARIVLFDDADRVLLQRGHDVDDVDRHWWFTPGGGIRPGEDPREAVVRELAEETGIHLQVSDLVGPVATRNAIFDFAREWARQDEVYFTARIRPPRELDSSGWTAVERRFLDDQRWIPATKVRTLPQTVYPTALPDLIEALLKGWDGTVRHLVEEDPPSRR